MNSLCLIDQYIAMATSFATRGYIYLESVACAVGNEVSDGFKRHRSGSTIRWDCELDAVAPWMHVWLC